MGYISSQTFQKVKSLRSDRDMNRNEMKWQDSFTSLKERMAIADWMS